MLGSQVPKTYIARMEGTSRFAIAIKSTYSKKLKTATETIGRSTLYRLSTLHVSVAVVRSVPTPTR